MALPLAPSPSALPTTCLGYLGTSFVAHSSQYWQSPVPAVDVCFADPLTAAEEHLIGL
jgi:hypothetical protein